MSFVIISACDALYGPTAISTEDAALHDQLSVGTSNPENSLTISRRRRRHDKHGKKDKLDKMIKKYEGKLIECRDEEKAEKLRATMESLCERKKSRIAINEETKINFDPYGKSIVFKVEDAPVRVLNLLATLGYSVLPSAGGGSHSHHGDGGGFVWTLFKPNYIPQPIYPKLHELATTD